MSDLATRLDLLKQPSPKINSYGEHKCGCSWDSGPYGLYCVQHDADQLIWDALTELCDAAGNVLNMGLPACDFRDRLEAAFSAVRRMRDEGVVAPT